MFVWTVWVCKNQINDKQIEIAKHQFKLCLYFKNKQRRFTNIMHFQRKFMLHFCVFDCFIYLSFLPYNYNRSEKHLFRNIQQPIFTRIYFLNQFFELVFICCCCWICCVVLKWNSCCEWTNSEKKNELENGRKITCGLSICYFKHSTFILFALKLALFAEKKNDFFC